MKIRSIFTMCIALLGFVACNNSKQLDNDEITELISSHLEEQPLFETAKFRTDKQKLVTNKDRETIDAIQKLTDDGFIEINDEKTRKRWFSKDSVHIITPVLTKETLPYLVKQNKNSAEVKTIIYKLNEKKITIEKNTENVAVCTVILDKEKTPFYVFGKDPYPNASFITQKFKLKYNENTGWKIIKK